MVPKLVADDIPLLRSLLSDVFPGIPYIRAEMSALRAKISEVCQEMNLVFGENDAKGSLWVEKVRTVGRGREWCGGRRRENGVEMREREWCG